MLAGYLARTTRVRYAALPTKDSFERGDALRNLLRIHSVLNQIGPHFNAASDIIAGRPHGDQLLHGHSAMLDLLRPEDFAQQIDQLIDAGGEESPSILPYLQALHHVFALSQRLPRESGTAGDAYITRNLLNPNAERTRDQHIGAVDPVGRRNFRLAMNDAVPVVLRAGYPAFTAIGRNAIGGNIDAMGTAAHMLDAARLRRDVLTPANFAELQDAKYHLLGMMRRHVNLLEDSYGEPFYDR